MNKKRLFFDVFCGYGTIRVKQRKDVKNDEFRTHETFCVKIYEIERFVVF